MSHAITASADKVAHDGRSHVQVLILGTGLAGLTCALELADAGHTVCLVTKSVDPSHTNTSWAQGGIIYEDEGDAGDGAGSLSSLSEDIQSASDHTSYPPAVEQLVRLGPGLVQSHMVRQSGRSVSFDHDETGSIDLVQEAAHSKPRIAHVGDATGKAMQDVYISAAVKHPNIKILSDHSVVDILTSQHHCDGLGYRYRLENDCCGAYLLDHQTQDVKTVSAEFTVLATGGASSLFLHSTNTRGSIGSGLALASRAGADILFPHYIQFHPTALWKGKRRFLISEALRGAGAQLLNSAGERFMQHYHPAAMEMAPRDELSRAIVRELVSRDDDCVYLDLSTYRDSHRSIEERFPTIFATCAEQGIDIRKDLIPVVPAAHYLCGGVKVDLDGKTSLDRLYAVGEVSCTGLHGANRLASTSLLECLVWGHTAASSMKNRLAQNDMMTSSMRESLKPWQHIGRPEPIDRQRIAGDWTRIRTMMWNYVGIIRRQQLLEIAVKDFRLLSESLNELYHQTRISKQLVELNHAVQCCRIIVESARRDSKSRGCHYLEG